ncbi:hydroxyacid dehydrogenase [Georgenia subflava]|nr:hydroxyacid dehydrogenase [Georgenia subflava]
MSVRPATFVAIRADEFETLFAPESRSALHRIGEVTFGGGEEVVEVPHGVADDFDVLVTSWSTRPFEDDVLTGGRLGLVAHAAGSVRGLLQPDSFRNGVRVTQCGSAAMAPAVAEMAVTMELALLRNLHTHDRRMQATRDWHRAGHGTLGHALPAARHGILGLSRTGLEYVSRIRGLGATRIAAADPYWDRSAAAEHGVELRDLDDVCRESDVFAVHAPSTPETRHIVDARRLALLPDGAIVLNTARSALIDEAALTAELVSGRLRAGLDVFDDEPLPADSPLFGLPNVILAPHVAGGTVEARHAQGAAVVEEVRRYAAGEPLLHEVTAELYHRLA